MKRNTCLLLLLLSVIGSFLAGSWYSHRDPVQGPASEGRRVLYYVDPMNPTHTSDKPGIAPCGMKMEPVYANEGPAAGRSAGNGLSLPAGMLKISPEKQQVIGVTVATVEKAHSSQKLRVLGRVTPDETRIYRINAATDGWVKRMLPVITGSLVRKNELLATFYAPEFFSAMKAYLYGLRSFDRFQKSGTETKEQFEVTDANIENYRNSLRNLGMTEHQLDEIMRSRQGGDHVEIRAPEAGFLLTRNITLGERFQRGTELYRIADLSKVWILADIFGNEAQYIQPGSEARVSVLQSGKEFRAMVTDTLPQFDAASRTLKVRLEVDNAAYILKPDMFVDVEFPVIRPAALTVPVDAVLDSGLKKTVFVDRGNGFFEPRQVETGWRVGGMVEITKVLMQGERIVVSGNFLIDSESRMKMATAGMQAASQVQRVGQRDKDPVCGMEADVAAAKAAGRVSEYRGKPYYFCRDECKTAFQESPDRYVKSMVTGRGSRAPEQAHSYAPPLQERANQSHSEEPAVNDPMGAHAFAHAPSR
jgi:Cu(I)/Ag(I) efflux system membrane fusion protein